MLGNSCSPPDLTPLTLSSIEDFLGFTWSSLLTKNHLLGGGHLIHLWSQSLPCLSAITYSGIPEVVLFRKSFLKQSRTCSFLEHNQAGSGAKGSVYSAQGWVSNCFLAQPMHQVWKPNHHHTGLGNISSFQFYYYPAHLLSFSVRQTCLFSEGKMSRWQLIEKQRFAFTKVFFENEYFFEVWIF